MSWRFLYGSALLLALGPVAFAADAPVPEPASAIFWPVEPVSPEPPSPPRPSPIGSPFKLSKGQVFVFTSKSPLVVIPSGTGKVSVALKTSAVTFPIESVPGWKADAGDPDFVTFAAGYTYIVKPLESGSVTLQCIPALNKVGKDKDGKDSQIPLKAADIVYKDILVDMNVAPQPPPPVPPDPPSPPTPPAPVTSFRVVWVHESGSTVPQAQISVMDSKVVRDYLTATTTKDGTFPGWRRWDKDVDAGNDFPAFKALWEGVKPKISAVPCVVIEINGKAEICPFPATPADAVTLFKSKNGGK